MMNLNVSVPVCIMYVNVCAYILITDILWNIVRIILQVIETV